MKIQKITSQNRRDFYALFECEFCGHVEKCSGYDDSYFHQSVIPTMKCDSCGKSTNLDTPKNVEPPRPLAPKYPEHEQH